MTWLHVVGIGEDGLDGLAGPARSIVDNAEVIFGGKRHLAMVQGTQAQCIAWPSPFDALLETMDRYSDRRVCVLASGDPTCFGVASRLSHRFGPDAMRVWPAPSAFSLARARLLWTFGDVHELTLHGRPLAELQRHIHAGARLLLLSWDERTPSAVAALLVERGYGDSKLSVLERLGGAHERIRAATASTFDLHDIHALNVVAVECVSGPDAVARSLAPGLPDALYEHDGQLTKRHVRAATLAALMPRPRQLLWDVGAGCGSVGIEWLLSGRDLQAFAIERNSARVAMIKRNAQSLGVPGLQCVHGEAPAGLDGLPQPNAVFVGGGVSGAPTLRTCMQRLRAGGRLVANAVTLQAQKQLQSMYLEHGGELSTLAVSHARAIGGFDVMAPAQPVMQWLWCKSS